MCIKCLSMFSTDATIEGSTFLKDLTPIAYEWASHPFSVKLRASDGVAKNALSDHMRGPMEVIQRGYLLVTADRRDHSLPELIHLGLMITPGFRHDGASIPFPLKLLFKQGVDLAGVAHDHMVAMGQGGAFATELFRMMAHDELRAGAHAVGLVADRVISTVLNAHASYYNSSLGEERRARDYKQLLAARSSYVSHAISRKSHVNAVPCSIFRSYEWAQVRPIPFFDREDRDRHDCAI